MKIYAIVVTYNGKKWIDRCFGSLINSSIPINILAIDNSSNDDTPQIIKDRFPQVEVIKANENLGFGRANNIGLSIILKEKADFAFLLNQDAWIENNTIEQLITTHNNNQQYGILSPLHLNADETNFEHYFKGYLSDTNTPNISFDSIHIKHLNKIYDTNFVNAAAWLLTYKCVKKIGFFDPIFFMYGEDNDYVNRLRYHNLKIGIVPKTRIFHDSRINTNPYNSHRALSYNILLLKNLNHSFKSLLLSFFKTNFDDFTSLILYRRPKSAFFLLKIFFSTLFLIKKISDSRKESISKSSAFTA